MRSIQWLTVHDFILQIFLYFLVLRGQVVRIFRFQFFQLVFLKLCEIDNSRVIGINRNAVRYGLFVVTKFILLVWPQWLAPFLLLLHCLEILLLIR